MAQPPIYERQYNFQEVIPGDVGNKLEEEFSEGIKPTVDALRTNLGLIQADDGRLRNNSVSRDALDDTVTLGDASVTGTSLSTFTVANSGDITPVLSTSKGWTGGTRLRLAVSGTPTTWVEGIINSYNDETGASNITLDRKNGTGSYSSWTVSIAGDPGSATVSASDIAANAGLISLLSQIFS